MMGRARAGGMGLGLMIAGTAVAAPELLVNGGCDRPVAQGWHIVEGSARTTGLIDGGDPARGGLGVLVPYSGFGFLVMGEEAPVSVVLQTGVFPFGSDRLAWRGWARLPERGSLHVTLTAQDDAGATLIESQADFSMAGVGWRAVSLTMTIPPEATGWTLRIEADDPGALGAHLDAASMIGTCLADYNGDRVLNFFDVSDFIADFLAGDPNADLTGNGVVDFFDITELIDSLEFPCD